MTQEKSVSELLDDLQSIVDALKANLPKEAPLFFSKSIDPLRALHLKEACIHRITELAESACDAFKKGNNVAGYLLARAIMETFALFWYFLDAVRKGLQHEDLDELNKILSRMLVGSRAEQGKESVREVFKEQSEKIAEGRLDPVRIPILIEYVTEHLPSFGDHYNFLCEIAHPNSMGLIRAYVKNDWNRRLTYFGKEMRGFGEHLTLDLETLIVFLEGFMSLYDESTELMKSLQALCNSN